MSCKNSIILKKEETKMKKVSIIIPCYNEEEALPVYFKAVDPIINSLTGYDFEFVLVNDGSKDNTLLVMEKLYKERDDVTIVNETHNFGQNPALCAGLSIACGDYVIMMDVDLQDPVELIPTILDKFNEGYEVVNPHRVNRMKDTAFKRKSASTFYKLMNKLEGKEVLPENVNCFRGLSRRAVDQLLSLNEKDKLLINEIPFIGYKTCTFDFSRNEREVGESKYTLKKMISYAFSNISAGTSKPLFTLLEVGGILLLFSLIFSLLFLVFFILGLCSIPFFSSPIAYEIFKTFFIISTIFVGINIILCFIGVIGLYLHNILINTRDRPTFIIDYVKRKDDK